MSKKKSLFNQIDDARSIVHDFRLRSSPFFEGYRTMEFRTSPELEDSKMLPVLEDRIKKLISSGALDQGNADVLDNLILSIGVEAETLLRQQAVYHVDLIRRLTLRRKTDRDDFVKIEARIIKEIDALEKEHKRILDAIELEKGAKKS